MTKLAKTCVVVVAVCLFASGARADEAEQPDGPQTILNTESYWRFRTVRQTPEVVTPEGEIVHGRVQSDITGTDVHGWFRANQQHPSLPAESWRVVPIPDDEVRTLPSDTPADWMAPDFNDDAWFRSSGPMFSNFYSTDEGWKLILMRGTFEVTDPARAGDLKLELEIRGGAVIYLNGEEVARAYMPDGPITLASPAEPYPSEADFTDEGFVLPWHRQETRRAQAAKPKEVRDRVASRYRHISDVTIPAGRLREGVNVLAIGIHRAPTPAVRHVCRHKGGSSVNSDYWWTRLGLQSIRLTASPEAAVVPNVGPMAGQGFRYWNHSIMQHVRVSDYPDPLASARPIQISATRNGSFSGQIVIGDERPISGLSVEVSDLEGPGVIPGSAVLVRYALPDGRGETFDSLDEVQPATVSVSGEHGRSVQPIWFTVRVPADARPGEYTGTVTITADGLDPVRPRLTVNVSNWEMPSPKTFHAHMDLAQSPESVAMAYDVPLWSDEHFALLDKTFELLGALGNKTLYITCIPRTHFGNQHAMVRWVRDDDGELHPDFSIAERYLDVARKHMGQIPGVILYAWEPPESQGHAGGTGGAVRTHDRAALYTLYEPETDEYFTARGPAWGSPESREFWKKLSDGMQKVLAERDLEDSMLFGLIGDHRPTKQAMDDISNGVPGARWAVHSHLRCEEWQGYEMGMFIALWGIRVGPMDPSRGYGFGWSNPQWMSYFPREMSLASRLTEYRCKLETWIGARPNRAPFIYTRGGSRGLGRLGADFWVVLEDGRGRPRWTLAGRYPETAWGQLNMNNGVARILGRGREGPIATVRSEAFREAAQEIEARVYLEKAWLDPEAPQILGEDMVQRCRELLDDRIRVVNVSGAGRVDRDSEAWFISSGWRDRSVALFDLAATVAAGYGDREPNPNLGEQEEGGEE